MLFEELIGFSFQEVALVLGIFIAATLAGGIALLVVAAQQIANIDVPEDADFFETLQVLPITVPIALDLLDMALDVLSAPLSWFILDLLGLQALKTITVFEGLLPGTQLIPTMTIAWGFSRIMKKRQPQSDARDAMRDAQINQRLDSSSRRRQLAAQYRAKALPAPTDIGGRDVGEVVSGDYVEYEEEYDPIDFYDDEEIS